MGVDGHQQEELHFRVVSDHSCSSEHAGPEVSFCKDGLQSWITVNMKFAALALNIPILLDWVTTAALTHIST